MDLLTDLDGAPPALQPSPRCPHAVVIGAGFGGLAAAIRLGVRGYRVTVLEKLDAPGGRASVFRQDGFTFDTGPTIVTAPFLLEELWRLCGRDMVDDVTLKPIDPFYQICFHDGSTFDCTGDPEAIRAAVARLSPGDVRGFECFMRLSETTCRIGFEQLGDVPFESWTDMARVAWDLARLGGHRSVYAQVSRFIKDERLRVVLSFHPLLIGGNPFTASAIYTLIPHLERGGGFTSHLAGRARSCAAWRD
jgi:phytoene desaturase